MAEPGFKLGAAGWEISVVCSPPPLLVNLCGRQVLESFSLYLPDLAALESHASANHPYTVADLDDATFEAVDGDYGDGVQLVRAKFRLKPNSI